MKKRILSFALAVVMLLGLVLGTGGMTLAAFAANEGVTIRLHYQRTDGKYDGWNVWFWDAGGEGHGVEFEDVNGEKVATHHPAAGTLEVGFIVRLNEWDAKDVTEDQFINIAGVLSGTVDVYVKAGVPTKEADIKFADDVVLGTVIVASRYNGENASGECIVQTRTSGPLGYEATLDTFKIGNSSGNVAITNVKCVNDTYFYLTLAEPLNLMRDYNITFEDTEYAIQMPDFYTSADFEAQYTYTGDDLGMTYTKEKTTLRLWAPTAIGVKVNLYTDGNPATQATPVEQVEMEKSEAGTWVVTLDGDKNGTYYTYEVTSESKVIEACDPYARTTGVNGKRAMIIDLDATDPEGWENDKDPHAGNKIVDAVIYELHVRDLSSDASSGIQNVGKYLGLIETGTKTPNGIPTGLDHMKDLGITHLHLLPVYDFGSVDESKLDMPQFNWGYDPVNYNVPEGSYSTDPFNGEVRVKEFKQMVKGLHDNGISVVMDVVYNHVYNAGQFCFNQIVPNYFSRPGANGSGCGNDTASERLMVSKYIVDSVKYWADEYHIDGFRFDLVGLIDTDTINTIIEEVHKTHPNVIFYGEGWTMTTKPTKPGIAMTTQQNAYKTPQFAFFSDTIRNLIKGGTYGGVSAGFISGGNATTVQLAECFKGMPSWCPSPSQSINYISCHDNNALFDHITMVTSGASVADRIKMNKLGVAFYMSAQGVPFFQAGEEFLRSKPNADGTFEENSYNAPDSVNSMKWNDLSKPEYQDVYNYYKGLIAFRKAHPALRLSTFAEVDANVSVVNGLANKVAAYEVKGGVNGETAEGIFLAFNANKADAQVKLPAGEWHICVNGEKAGVTSLGTASGTVTVPALSAVILVKGEVESGAPETTVPETTAPEAPAEPKPAGFNWGAVAGIAAGMAVAAAAGAAIAVATSKKKEN